MKSDDPKYEFPIEGLAFSGKPGEPAAIYFLDGGWHLAALDSMAEALLCSAGALHVATLVFPVNVGGNPWMN
jgi:hypothetical protein